MRCLHGFPCAFMHMIPHSEAHNAVIETALFGFHCAGRADDIGQHFSDCGFVVEFDFALTKGRT